MHFHREKFIEKGGPDGGDGGRGGHVILKGNAQLWTLLHLKFRKHIRAENGTAGEGQNMTGAFGKDVIIDRKSTRLNSSHERLSRMPSSA